MASEKRTLVIRSWDAGFFSNFNGVLNNLRHRLGRRGVEAAVVEWHAAGDEHQFPYGRAEDGNLWLHFFEPLPFDRFPAATREVRRFANRGMTWRNAYAMYKLDPRWRHAYHELYRRHIRVRPAILERVETIYRSRMDGRYCVGVHCRHPTHDLECLHPIPSIETFIARLRTLLPADRPWAIFLATDIEPAVEAFRRAFGDRLVLQPGVKRAPSLERDHLHHDNDRPSLALGEQVLVDCLLLARCDVFLHVTSNLATAAGYMNPALKMVYCETPAQAFWGYLWSIIWYKAGFSRLGDWVRWRVQRRSQRKVG